MKHTKLYSCDCVPSTSIASSMIHKGDHLAELRLKGIEPQKITGSKTVPDALRRIAGADTSTYDSAQVTSQKKGHKIGQPPLL